MTGPSLLASALIAASTLGAPASRAPVAYTDAFTSYLQDSPMQGQASPAAALWTSEPFVKAFRRTGPPIVPQDISQDGLINSVDLALMLGAWGPCAGDCPADVNFDHFVNSADLALLLGAWGETDEPVPAFAMVFDRETLPRVLNRTAFAAVDVPPVQGATGDPARASVRFRCEQGGGQHVEFAATSAGAGDDLVTVAMGGYPTSADLGPFTEKSGLLRRICVRVVRPGGAATVWATGKDLVGARLFTLTIEATPESVRVLIEDPETRQTFGAGPVEIFPAGPYGPAREALGALAPVPVAPAAPARFDRVRFYGGLDPAPFDFPGWVAAPVWATDLMITGPMAP